MMAEQLWREWNPDRDNPDGEDIEGMVRYDTPGGQRFSVAVLRVADGALLIEDPEALFRDGEGFWQQDLLDEIMAIFRRYPNLEAPSNVAPCFVLEAVMRRLRAVVDE